MVWEECEYFVQTIWSHLLVFFAVGLANELLKELVAPQFVVGRQLLEEPVEVLVEESELHEHVF